MAPYHLKAILITGFFTGMRLGEILKLQWSHYDRDNKYFRLPASIVKEEKPKSIPLNHHVIEVLSNMPRALNHDHVFTYRGVPINSTGDGGIKKSFQTACKNANVPYGRKTPDGITFHDFRRTLKNNMLKAGINKAYRDKILGHTSRDMDVYYLHVDDSQLTEAMEKFTTWIDGEMKKVKGPHMGPQMAKK